MSILEQPLLPLWKSWTIFSFSVFQPLFSIISTSANNLQRSSGNNSTKKIPYSFENQNISRMSKIKTLISVRIKFPCESDSVLTPSATLDPKRLGLYEATQFTSRSILCTLASTSTASRSFTAYDKCDNLFEFKNFNSSLLQGLAALKGASRPLPRSKTDQALLGTPQSNVES